MSLNATVAAAVLPEDCVCLSKILRNDSVGSSAARLRQQTVNVVFLVTDHHVVNAA